MTADLVPVYEEYTEPELNSNWESQRCLESAQNGEKPFPALIPQGLGHSGHSQVCFSGCRSIRNPSCVLPSPPCQGWGTCRVLLAQNFEHSPNHFQQNYSFFQSDHEVTQRFMFSQLNPCEPSMRVIEQPCEHIGEDGNGKDSLSSSEFKYCVYSCLKWHRAEQGLKEKDNKKKIETSRIVREKKGDLS